MGRKPSEPTEFVRMPRRLFKHLDALKDQTRRSRWEVVEFLLAFHAFNAEAPKRREL